jgi:hypothetical protein
MSTFHDAYKSFLRKRVAELKKIAEPELLRYSSNLLPLFTDAPKNKIRYVTMSTIESDMKEACANGLTYVEYNIHTHYYPGYKRDNFSFFTGKYYIYNRDMELITINGAPSYIECLQQKLPGLSITFRECDSMHGYLRVELPKDLARTGSSSLDE